MKYICKKREKRFARKVFCVIVVLDDSISYLGREKALPSLKSLACPMARNKIARF